MTPRPALLAAGVFAALAAALYVVLPPGFALRFDNIGQNLPAMLEVYRQGREGHLPLWNPYMWSGAPLLGDPQTQVLYPLSWLGFALTGPTHTRALDLEFVLDAALSGWFCFLYLAALGATAAGALVGALVYALNPHFMSIGTAFINWHAALAWIPLVLYGIERARVDERPGRWLALAAAAFAVQLFAGHPQVSAYTVLFVLPYGLVRAAGSTRRRALTAMAGPIAIGGGAALAAVLLLPAYDMWAASQRAVPPVGNFGRIAVTWSGLAAAALPGVPVEPAIAPNAWTHLGVVPVVFALLALRRPTVFRVFLGATAAAAIVLSSGPEGPVASFILNAPGLRLFRGAFKFYLLVVLAIATLAGLGLADWQRARVDRTLGFLLLAALAASGAGILFATSSRELAALFWSSPRFLWQAVVSATFLVALGAALLSPRITRALPALAVAATAAALLVEASAYLKPNGLTIARVFSPTPEILPRLRAPEPPLGVPGRVIWVGTLGLYHRIETANGYSGFINLRYGEATGWGQHGVWLPWRTATEMLAGSNRVLDVLGVRYLVLDEQQAPTLAPIQGLDGGPRFRAVGGFAGDMLFENTQRLPRVYLASRVARAPEQAAAIALVKRGAVDPTRSPIVEVPVPGLADGAPDAGGEVALLDRIPARLRLRASSPRPALLVVSDAFDPGWRARVDGAPTHVLRVNGLTRGVVLPAGQHEVELFYWPASLTRGVLVSAATALLAVLVVRRRL